MRECIDGMSEYTEVYTEEAIMTHASSYGVNTGWRILQQDVGIRPVDVLRRAELPEDLFIREGATRNTAEYFRLWRGLESDE
jgi:hypothetical protein